MSFPKIGDLVSLNAECYADPWVYEVGLILDDGERPPRLFDESYPTALFLVRWNWGDKWHPSSDLIIVSASNKDLNTLEKM
tara:strand:- start:491 stop:733 length:243 start_codon:yes stop_codon:yes gene_type:complete